MWVGAWLTVCLAIGSRVCVGVCSTAAVMFLLEFRINCSSETAAFELLLPPRVSLVRPQRWLRTS